MEISTDIPRNVVLSEFYVGVVFLIISIPLILWYHSRSRLFPINGCDPHILVLIGHLSWLGRLSDSLAFFTFYPCALSQSIRALVYVVMVSLYLLRAWSLLYRFEVTALLIDVNQKQRERRPSALFLDNWYVRHRYLIRPSFFVVVVSCNFALALLYVIADLRQGGDFCPLNYSDRGIVSKASRVHIIALSVCAVFLAYKLYNVKGNDAYGVKDELKKTACNALLWQIINIIYAAKVGNRELVLNGFDYWYRFFVGLPVIWWAFGSKIYRSYQWEKQNNPQLLLNQINLQKVLSTEEGIQSFLLYLKKEFSTENLLYYISVTTWLEMANKHPQLHSCDAPSQSPRSMSHSFFPNPVFQKEEPMTPTSTSSPSTYSPSKQFQQSFPQQQQPQPSQQLQPSSTTIDALVTHDGCGVPSPSQQKGRGIDVEAQSINNELAAQINTILETYLREHAKFSINLADETRRKAISAVETYISSGQTTENLQFLINSLDRTKHEIFHLMESDSFQRYLRSSQFDNFRSQYIQSHANPPSPPQSLLHQTLHQMYEEEKNKSKRKADSKQSKHSGGGSKGGGSKGADGGDRLDDDSKTGSKFSHDIQMSDMMIRSNSSESPTSHGVLGVGFLYPPPSSDELGGGGGGGGLGNEISSSGSREVSEVNNNSTTEQKLFHNNNNNNNISSNQNNNHNSNNNDLTHNISPIQEEDRNHEENESNHLLTT